jgi:hypothetical protein
MISIIPCIFHTRVHRESDDRESEEGNFHLGLVWYYSPWGAIYQFLRIILNSDS